MWWRSRSGAVAPEVGIDVVIPIADPGSGDSVRVTGSIDALETTADGASVVWDFKTRRTRFTRQQVAQSIQLATYQLAVLGGGGTTGGAGYVQLCLPAAAGAKARAGAPRGTETPRPSRRRRGRRARG